ncbi:hypothetical protein [Chitinophaga sp. MM2321]|uniref:hypothetical protein n=1 Tax=Chitinophaga sp. MM2321 TaxID=3137178 RepID=UPI0032D57805
MRLKLFVTAVIAAAATALTGCDPKKNDISPISTFSFKVDTLLFRSNATQAYFTDTISAHRKTMVIDGVTNNFGHHLELMITFPDSIHTGQYTTGVELSLMKIQQDGIGYIGKTITVKIESINSKQAEGTFSGTLISGDMEKPLTDGTFKVNF